MSCNEFRAQVCAHPAQFRAGPLFVVVRRAGLGLRAAGRGRPGLCQKFPADNTVPAVAGTVQPGCLLHEGIHPGFVLGVRRVGVDQAQHRDHPAILGVVYSKYKYEFRVSSPIFVTTFIGIILYLNTYKQADYKFTTKYWKYALVLSIPLLPHYLSIKILNQVDRVMITQMVGLSETGLYNLACTVSNLMIIATDAINRSMCPYVYKSIKNKNILPVRKMTSSILLVVMVVSFLEMLIAPELIKIFATDDYLDAIYVIPPVAMSIYFIFLYVVFANVEFYFEKTIFATIVSGIAAVMNIGMNYIFLKKYGYYAAGYTTLICYMLFALLHYWNYKRILKREPYLNGIFDIRHVLLISFSGLALMGICLLLYRYSVIRFSLVIIIITISFYFRNQLKSIIKTSNN